VVGAARSGLTAVIVDTGPGLDPDLVLVLVLDLDLDPALVLVLVLDLDLDPALVLELEGGRSGRCRTLRRKDRSHRSGVQSSRSHFRCDTRRRIV